MAGHSKWANIKHRKGRQDEKKGKVFTKLARAITVAVKEGGADPEYNTALANAVEKAKNENMPNDNINRAIKKGSGEDGGENYESIVYEGYAPGGVAFLLHALTDNKNRTAADVRHYFTKTDGNLGATGCVAYLFNRKGVIAIDNENYDEEEVFIDIIEYGGEDIKFKDDIIEIETSPESYKKVLSGLKGKYSIIGSELAMLPDNYIEVNDDENIKKLEKLIDMLEDNDDIQEIYHNGIF